MSSELLSSVTRGLEMVTACVNSQVLAGIPEEDASKRLFESYTQRIEALPRLKADAESVLISSIGKSGFNNAQKTSLIKTVQSKLCARSMLHKERSKMQSCEQYENMIPDSLWDSLKNTERSDEATATILAQHGCSIGLVNASEKTLKRMVSVLGFVQKYQRMDQERYSLLKASIQEQLHALASTINADYPYLVKYCDVNIIRSLEDYDRMCGRCSATASP